MNQGLRSIGRPPAPRVFWCAWAALVVLASLIGVSANAQDCYVAVSSIDGAYYEGSTARLVPGYIQTVHLRHVLRCVDTTWTCGFNVNSTYLIFSPDGADWGYVQGFWDNPAMQLGYTFVLPNHFSKTGGTGDWGQPSWIGEGNVSGNDSVAVSFSANATSCESGLHFGYVLAPFCIRFSPTYGSVGKHICIDTASNVPGGGWQWPSISPSHPDLVPSWYSEARCYQVVECCFGESAGNINMSFDGLVTMADLTVLIDHLFINLTPLMCPFTANLDQSPDGLVTMDDLTVLIDHLYITLAPLPACL
jgi:hypothetical protein